MTPLKPITLTTSDHASLKIRLRDALAAKPKNRTNWIRLRDELDRADVLPAGVLPPSIVRVGSTFVVQDLDSAERDKFTLVWPENADISAGRLSVLSPLGIAVIGFAVHDEITWEMPGGVRRLRLESVTYEPSQLHTFTPFSPPLLNRSNSTHAAHRS